MGDPIFKGIYVLFCIYYCKCWKCNKKKKNRSPEFLKFCQNFLILFHLFAIFGLKISLGIFWFESLFVRKSIFGKMITLSRWVNTESNLLSETLKAFKAVGPHRSGNYFLRIDDVLSSIPHGPCSVDVFRNEKFSLRITDTPVQCKHLRLKWESGSIREIPRELILNKKEDKISYS